ncbi:MAG: hypothetical protein N3G80_04605 [Candidatus Micrarchaeota archaeon]|nr:hypothetical protein [Candidatus Micrarchaeota archaeon]
MQKQLFRLSLYDPNEGQLLTQIQAIAKANQKKFRLLSNKELDHILFSPSLPQEMDSCQIWTGTLCAYEVPRKFFSNFIQYFDKRANIDVVFEVPYKFVGSVGLLVVNQDFDRYGNPLITVENKEKVFLLKVHDLSKVHIIKDFPECCGWYPIEERFGIPIDTQMHSDSTRHLVRLEDASYVGLLLRHASSSFSQKQTISINQPHFHQASAFCTTPLNPALEEPGQMPAAEKDFEALIREAEEALNSLKGKVEEQTIKKIKDLVNAIKLIQLR